MNYFSWERPDSGKWGGTQPVILAAVWPISWSTRLFHRHYVEIAGILSKIVIKPAKNLENLLVVG